MKESEMLEEFTHDFNIWFNSPSESFLYINQRSRIPNKWLSYDRVLSGKYKDSIIKPSNLYVENLYIRPELVSIEGNTIRLRQGNHAEFFLLENDDEFYNKDRPWMRQYYMSDMDVELPGGCFPGNFRFYVPWFIDLDVIVKIKKPDAESPFYIYEREIDFKKTSAATTHIDPPFVNFHFKRVGSHMIDEKFSKVRRNSPMFDMVFEADDIIVQRVREFYNGN
jgi:hypothetical protein